MSNEMITVAPISIKVGEVVAKETENMLDNPFSREDYSIANQTEYEKVGEFRKRVNVEIKTLTGQQREITKPLNEAKTRAMDLFRRPLEMLKKAKGILDNSMIAYEDRQEAIRRAQEEKLRRQAAAEEERKRKALEEQARKQEEKAAELRRQAAEADEREKKILEEKAKLADEQAELRREKKEDVFVPAPIVPSQVTKIKGLSGRDNWKFRVIDEKLVPREYLCVDSAQLTGIAKATKGRKVIDGIEFYNDKIKAS